MAEKDIAEKTLESYNDVFADIVNGLLFQGRSIVAEDALTDAQPFSMYKAEGGLHEQERDVSKYWGDYPVRIALLGLENQTDVDRDMPLRVMGYDGAAYRAQLGECNRYPVVTLVLYFGERRWQYRTLHECLNIPSEMLPYVSDYRINVFEIAWLTDEQINRFHSDFQIVADYFAHKRVDKDYRPNNPRRFDHQNEMLKLMAAISRDYRFTDTLSMKGGAPENMCEVLDRVEMRGEKRGITIGAMNHARQTALNLRDKGVITDPVLVAQMVEVDVQQVKRWFTENQPQGTKH